MRKRGKKDVIMKKLLCSLCLTLSIFAAQGELSHVITPRGGNEPLSANKEIVKQFYEAFSQNEPRKMNELLASNYKVQDSNVIFDSSYSKYDAFSKNLNVRMRALHESLPNFKLTVIEMFAEGNKVIARIQIQGVQRNAFLGVEATDKPVVIKEFAILTIDGGKITNSLMPILSPFESGQVL